MMSPTVSLAAAQVLKQIRERRFATGLHCPRCRALRPQRWGRYRGRQRYRCVACRRTFSDLTGTPLAYSKRLSAWSAYLRCMAEAIPLREAARLAGVHASTAFRWRHRLLAAIRLGDDVPLEGFVEVLEVILPEARKGCRDLGRPARTHGMQWCPWYSPRVFLMLACDRRGGGTALITEARPPRAADLSPLASRLGTRAMLLAPFGRAGVYRRWCRTLAGRDAELECVAVPSGSLPGDTGLRHRTTVTRLRLEWRRWMVRFRGVSTRYLLNYLVWFRLSAAFDEDSGWTRWLIGWTT